MIWRKLLKRKILIRLFLLLMTAYMSYISLVFPFNNNKNESTESRSSSSSSSSSSSTSEDDLFLFKNNYNNLLNVKNQYEKLSNWMNYSQIKYNGNAYKYINMHVFI